MSHSKLFYFLKNFLALLPFIITLIIVCISSLYKIYIPAVYIALMTLVSIILSKNAFNNLRKSVEKVVVEVFEKYSTNDDYMAFFDSIYDKIQKVSNYNEYLLASEKLYPSSSPFTGKKINFYYENGSLYKISKNSNTPKKLQDHSVANKFSEWKITLEKKDNKLS